MSPPPNQLLSRLNARVDRHLDRGDAELVLAPAALAEAAAVAEALATMDDALRREAVAVLGQFHLCRFRVLPEGADTADFFTAIRCFTELPSDALAGRLPQAWRPLVGSGDGESLMAAAYEIQGRLEQVDDPWARDHAIVLWRAALAALAADHPARPRCLSSAGIALLARAERTTAYPEDLAEGIRLLREALRLLPPEHTDRPDIQGVLSTALQGRYLRTGNAADLDEAVSGLREIVDSDVTTPHHLIHMYHYTIALMTRFAHRRDVTDVDLVVRLARRLVRESSDDPEFQALAANGLLVALQARYEFDAREQDLAEAIDVGRQLAANRVLDDVDRGGVLSNLSLAHRSDYLRTNDVARLDEGIEAAREAVRLTPADHPNRPGVLNNLGQMLQMRALRSGATEDVQGAVEASRAAVGATPPGHTDYPGCLAMHGVALWASYLQSREVGPLDEAVRVLRRAAGTIPPGHPDRGGFLTNLAVALSTRATLAEHLDRAIFDEAVRTHREAIRATAAESAERPSRLVNLAIGLNALAQMTVEPLIRDESPGALTEAMELTTESIEAIAEALDALPADGFGRIGAQLGLARAHWLRYECGGRAEDGEAAIAAWREVAANPRTPVRNRIFAAREYASLQATMHGLAAALDGYGLAVGLLPLLAWRGLSRPDQQRRLAAVSGLAADAAAAAIAAGQPERAVEMLEQARGVLWTQLLETRADTGALRAVDPDLADEFEQVRAALNGPAFAAPHGLTMATPADPDLADLTSDVLDQRGDVAERFESVVARIRALPPSAELPHPERFLRPTPWADLASAIGDRDVVVVTVSRWRSDALVISGGGIRVVELPELHRDEVEWRVAAHLPDAAGAASGAGAGAREIGPQGSIAGGAATLSWLWNVVAEPVLNALGRGPVSGDWPRLWWCPTGALALLPLHAAGRHDVPGCSVLDRVISSYTPTLRALTTVSPPAPAEEGMLVVSMPQTPGHSPLPAVDEERRLLDRMLATAPRRLFLDGGSATRAAVREALSQHRRAHFSCHGTQDLTDPSRGGLVLHDGLLSIADLLVPGQVPGDWAFLSACRTATAGLSTVDEAITLAAALRYGGWRHVIGTLWSVDDATAAQATELVYGTAMVGGTLRCEAAAEALHLAARRLRDEDLDGTGRWAPFIHLGA